MNWLPTGIEINLTDHYTALVTPLLNAVVKNLYIVAHSLDRNSQE